MFEADVWIVIITDLAANSAVRYMADNKPEALRVGIDQYDAFDRRSTVPCAGF
jgi:hypothetical protein